MAILIGSSLSDILRGPRSPPAYLLDPSDRYTARWCCRRCLCQWPVRLQPLSRRSSHSGILRRRGAGNRRRAAASTHRREQTAAADRYGGVRPAAAFSAESYDLAAALCVSDGKCPPFLWLSGHNHMTEFLASTPGTTGSVALSSISSAPSLSSSARSVGTCGRLRIAGPSQPAATAGSNPDPPLARPGLSPMAAPGATSPLAVVAVKEPESHPSRKFGQIMRANM